VFYGEIDSSVLNPKFGEFFQKDRHLWACFSDSNLGSLHRKSLASCVDHCIFNVFASGLSPGGWLRFPTELRGCFLLEAFTAAVRPSPHR